MSMGNGGTGATMDSEMSLSSEMSIMSWKGKIGDKDVKSERGDSPKEAIAPVLIRFCDGPATGDRDLFFKTAVEVPA